MLAANPIPAIELLQKKYSEVQLMFLLPFSIIISVMGESQKSIVAMDTTVNILKCNLYICEIVPEVCKKS